jgi:glycosyltransferase involved in cell wall biosynthesis
MRKLRILVVGTSMAPPAIYMRGSKTVYSLQRELAKKNVEIHILTHLDKRQDKDYKKFFLEQKKRGIIFHYFDFAFAKHIPFFYHLFASFFYIPMVYWINRKYKFDIVHEYSSSPALFYRAYFYKKFGIKKTFHTIQTYNTTFMGSHNLSGGIKYLDYAIGVTQDMVKKIKEKNQEYKRRIIHLPLGVSLHNTRNQNLEALKKKYVVPKRKKIVLYVGPLEEGKGAFVFRDAIYNLSKKNSDLFFIVLTYGPEGGSWEMKKFYNASKREFLLKISGFKNLRIYEGLHSVDEFFTIADFFVLPLTTSHGTLGHPAVLVEAMSKGLAVIASDIAGVNELITTGKNGILVRPRDPKDLAKGILELNSNPRLASRIKSNAKQTILEKQFNQKHIAKLLYNLYQNS